jgi:SAM-dependent methyltransferase
VRRAISNILQVARTQGGAPAIRLLASRLTERYYERRFWIESALHVAPEELGYNDPDCHEYVPSGYSDFRALMRAIPLRKNQDVFLDYGAGKGRALIMAGTYPFRRIIGVELSAQLLETAQLNIERARRRLRCKEIELVNADASSFIVPTDVTVIYFFNPFHGAVLAAALENIRRSITELPRLIHILCTNPSSQSRFDLEVGQCPWLVRHCEVPLYNRFGVVYTNSTR